MIDIFIIQDGIVNMNFANELSLEQQFKLTIYHETINKLDQQQSQQYLVDILKQAMMIDNIIKHMVKNAPF